ncbi:MAG: SemiSWEET family transporter [Patescibacteria group bacterium]
MITFESVVGILGSLTAASLFFPQVYVSWKAKRTGDLAWFGIIVGMLNGVFWSTYGFLKMDPFIYVTNSILFLGASLLMLLKLKYK